MKHCAGSVKICLATLQVVTIFKSDAFTVSRKKAGFAFPVKDYFTRSLLVCEHEYVPEGQM